jgi:opacity protein-like surface antigen
VAWVDTDFHLTCNGIVGGGICLPVGATAERSSVTRVGGVVGAGVEYAVTKNLILGVEGDYLPLGTRTETFIEPPGYACGSWRRAALSHRRQTEPLDNDGTA